MSGTTTEALRDHSAEVQISARVVQSLRGYTGRGPTKAWTTITGDLVSVVLRDTLTQGERSLVADDRAELVLDVRKAYQNTMRDELVAGVEEITGRRVIAFLSDNHMDPDIAIENFVLEPLEGQNGATPTR
ncbi:MAG: Na-translocating system protein MpsC family protein [Solirubrobacteraceae bacterium]